MMFFSVKPRDMALDFLPLHLLGFGFGYFHDISREFNFDIFDLTTYTMLPLKQFPIRNLSSQVYELRYDSVPEAHGHQLRQ